MLLRKRKSGDGKPQADGKRSDRRSKGQSKLQAVLGEAEIPTFPLPVIKSLEALRDPRASASSVAEALEMDPGLTVRLLKLVNSATFSPAKPVESVDRAVAVAGFSAVESLVLSVGVNRALPSVAVEGFDQVRFWRAAARRATIARALAVELHPSSASLAFTAGLLQDMAVPLLAANRPDYPPLLVEWHNGGTDLHVMEEAAFGWSHGEIAQMLCDEWGLPEALAGAISAHHVPAGEVLPAVRLAAPFREQEHPEIVDGVVTWASEEFGLQPDRVVELIDHAVGEAEEVAGLFT